jgi:Acetyltransferase (GNAT) family
MRTNPADGNMEIWLHPLDGREPRLQRSGLGARLHHEIERRMHQEGVRMTFVDTARSNTAAIKFFKRMGYGRPEAEVWMSKVIQRTRKLHNNKTIHQGPRKLHVGRHRKAPVRQRSRKSKR